MSQSNARRGLLRFAADRYSVAFVVGVLGIHLAVYFLASKWVALACVFPLVILSTSVASLNHHHQHLGVFFAKPLNRLYDLVMALQTGIGPYTWVLHHNLGHHQNYLHQYPHTTPDESHWTRADGSKMGRVEYSLHLFFHHQFDVYRVGKKHPKVYRSYLLMKVPLYTIIALGLWFNPFNAVFAFLLPGMITLLHTCWATYEHHAGAQADTHFEASVNRENWLFNLMSWNLGYHTAHHYRPGVHWSQLPELHRQIENRIPEAQRLQTFW